ncbi:MAG: diguanylate cyclase/phosphodiesterase [Actinomycetia bacterium]|nr:diguanylate cyclase/phosphodiesterase [Actinomycetes bacterium]
MQVARVAAVAALPRKLRLLVAVVAVVGVGCLLVAVAGVVGNPPASWWSIAGVVALSALSRIVRLRLRLGSSAAFLDWSEATLIVALGLISGPWLVIASAAGIALSNAWIRVDRVKLVYNVAAATIATTLAWVVLVIMHVSPHRASSTVYGATALVLAALMFTAVSELATGTAVGLSKSVPVWSVCTDALGMKFLIFTGNVSIAFAVVAVAQAEKRALAVIPPVLWLLHQSYAGRVRARAERRAWQSLAAATHSFNRLGVNAVVDAAVVGAATLFAADVVELELSGPDGDNALTRGDASGSIWRGGDLVRAEPTVLTTVLYSSGGSLVGELRLCFRSPEVPLGERERLALSTFADSLSSALVNAQSHEQLRSLAERKAYEAEHDQLTGLSNRAHLLDSGARMLERPGWTAPPLGAVPAPGEVAEPEQPLAVALLLLDFDHFKEVNDTLGHGAGDELLRLAAERLASARRPDEVLGRLGGDEFALLLPVVGDVGSATAFAKRRAAALLTAVAEPIPLGQIWLTVEASVGVAVTAPGEADIAELLRRADIAMYQAKRTAQTVVSYDAGKDAGSIDRLALAAELQTALEEGGQLILNLQPSIDLVTGAPLGAEALVRWQHPRRGLLRPGDFIPFVEQTDLIGPLTMHILDMALAACVSWEDGGLELPVAVNLSARSLLDRQMPGQIATLLAAHGVPPERLVLEITETVMMSELEIIEDILTDLRELGVQLSLDDFGTWYSSLTVLAKVKVDEVKIDQEFVSAMHSSPEAAAIVRTTIELARSLGLRVIAEGVENAEQRAVLAQLGCTGAQGYHIYPPMDVDKAKAAMWMAAQSAAEQSTATVIPMGPKRAPWLGRRQDV